MKKTIGLIFVVSMLLLMLSACASEPPRDSASEVEGAQVGSTTDENPAEGSNEEDIPANEPNGEIIPEDEWAILKNEPHLYEGRPIANVPVEVISVERYSDRVVIEASLYEQGSGHYFTLVQLDSSQTDIEQRDALYINGVVRNDIDTKSNWPSAATKVALTDYDKVEFADLLDPVVTTREINLTLENDLFAAAVHSVDVGERFTRIYFTQTHKSDNFSGNIEAVLVTSEGEFPSLDTRDAFKISNRAYSEDGRRALVFDSADISDGFTLKMTGIPFTWSSEEELVPLVFEVE